MKACELESILPQKKRSISDLSRFLKNRAQENPNYCFLLGAGASVTSGIRSAGELVTSWRKEIFMQLNSQSDGHESDSASMQKWLTANHSNWYDVENEYASLFERKYDLPSQRRMFVEQEVEGAIPSIGYAYLTNLVKANFTNTIFTTNFDDLLNEAFFRFTDIRPYVCAHDSSVKGITITSKRPKIIKLHGDYLFDDIKCTNESTSTLEANMSEKLRQFLREFGLIVSGYAGCDKSIMDTLNSLITDESFLRHGVYWCLRPEDEINKPLLTFLKKEKVYFCLTDGFDELFAELNQICCSGDISFFDSTLSTKSLNYSDYWLKSRWLASSKSTLIRGHLNDIEKYRKNSNFAQALTKLRSDDDREEIKKEKLTDEETLFLIEIEKLIDRSKYEQAARRLEECISESSGGAIFKKELLKMSYGIFHQLGEITKAKLACTNLIKMEPRDPAYSIWQSRLEPNINEKIKIIENAIAKDPYYWLGHHELAQVKLRATKLHIANSSSETFASIENSFLVSIDRRPSLSNPSWKSLFEHLLENERSRKDEKLLHILSLIQKQDKYRPSVVHLAFLYCKHAGASKVDSDLIEGGDIFSYLNKAIESYYPKNNHGFWQIIVETSIEFKNHAFAKKHLQKFQESDFNGDLQEYHLAMAEYYLDIEKDIPKAIQYLKDKFNEIDSPTLLVKYVNWLIYTNEVSLARSEFERHSHILDHLTKVTLEASILSAERKASSAIDKLSTLSDDPYFDKKHSTAISYAYLLSNEYQKAYEYCNRVVSASPLTEQQYPMRVNYEFAKLKLGKKVNKSKLDELIQTSQDNDIKAVSHLLIGDKEKCLELLNKEIEKSHSKLMLYLTWPVLESLKFELKSLYNFETQLVSVKTA